ncbi:hypothetical protein LDENG_00267260 [Lucifuga dentata]|nr:hypothetical protein LDENG_00267260 [Lucifuga dentata]
MKTFYTCIVGITLDSHKVFVEKLKREGATEVDSHEDSDVTIVFCPIASRVRSDIASASSKITDSGFKRVILVVMHHTHNPNYTFPKFTVEDNNSVILVVHCLFFEGKGLLRCRVNNNAIKTVIKEMDLPQSPSLICGCC